MKKEKEKIKFSIGKFIKKSGDRDYYFGQNLGRIFYDISQMNGDDFFGFVQDLCEENPGIKEMIDDFNKTVTDKIENSEIKKEIGTFLWCLSDKFGILLITLGYTLGQIFEVHDPAALEEIKFLSKRIKDAGILNLGLSYRANSKA